MSAHAWRLALAMLLASSGSVGAHPPDPPADTASGTSSELAPFLADDAEVFLLTNARVIDGTGAAPVERQALLLRGGVIEAIGDTGTLAAPAGARVLDLQGQTVLPGLVQLHEHLWTYAGAPLAVPVTYPRLYLAGGVTSIRTAGAYHPYADLKAKRDIDAGRAAGPWMDLTLYTAALTTPLLETRAEVERYLGFWFDSGFTSVKVYAYTPPEVVRWIVDYSKARGAKVLGHLCTVRYADAAAMGMDSIEHGFVFLPDFVPAIQSGEATGRDCPLASLDAMAHLDEADPRIDALIAKLVASGTVITSTLPALEDLLPGGGSTDGHDLLAGFVRQHNAQYRTRASAGEGLILQDAWIRKSARLERRFHQAGGRLVAGTDSTVPSGGVVPGYSAARQLEMMVDNGFTPLEAIRISTLDGAGVLGRADLVGSIVAGKQADLLVVEGNPADDISSIRNVRVVFKAGVAFDPAALRESVRGRVGLD